MSDRWKRERLPFSRSTNSFISNIGYHSVAELQQIDMYDFLSRCKHCRRANEVIDELVREGVLQEVPGQLKLSQLDISARLRNILYMAGMRYLAQAETYSYEDYTTMRNMGRVTLNELLEVCAANQIKIWSNKDLPVELKKIGLHPTIYAKWCAKGITSLSDLQDRSFEELVAWCEGDEGIARKINKLHNSFTDSAK